MLQQPGEDPIGFFGYLRFSAKGREETMTIIKANFGDRPSESTVKTEKKEDTPAPLYQLHVSLAFSDPLIWRRLLVPGELTLRELHQVLQVCMSWSGEFNHQFYIGKIFYSASASSTAGMRFHEANHILADLEEAMKWCCTYIYDAGAGWEHEIVLEDALPPAARRSSPRVVDGEWAVPPESIDGVHSYSELLYAWENPEDRQSKKLLEAHDLSGFDPYRFDKEAINEELERCGRWQ